MGIRHMRMLMPLCFVPMPMAVLACGHHVVRVQMVSIVMRMGMFVLKDFMLMRVTVGLH